MVRARGAGRRELAMLGSKLEQRVHSCGSKPLSAFEGDVQGVSPRVSFYMELEYALVCYIRR